MKDSDEREEAWRTRSNLFAFATIALVAWIGILGTGGFILWSGLAVRSLPSHHQTAEPVGSGLLAFGCYLMVLFLTLPTLHASWTMPEPIEDEPEAEAEEGLRFVKPRR